MTQRNRAGRQAAARQRKQRQQRLRIGAVVIVLALVTVGVMIAFTGDDSEPVSQAPQAQSGPAPAWEAERFTGGPRLAVDRVAHEQGAVQYGEPVEATFWLRNVGDEPLELADISVNTLEGC